MEECTDSVPSVAFDWSRDESVSTAVVMAVGRARGVEPDEQEPLHTTIDPDALDTLFSAADVPDPGGLSVEFTYAGYRVRVDGTGEGRLVDVT